MRNLKIIIVENDKNERTFINDGFDESGLFEILASLNDGDELFDALRNRKIMPELILSDLNMPRKNGCEILAEIKKDPEFLHIPVVIMSTSATKINIDTCMELGAHSYMVKPDTFLEYREFAVELYHKIINEFSESETETETE